MKVGKTYWINISPSVYQYYQLVNHISTQMFLLVIRSHVLNSYFRHFFPVDFHFFHRFSFMSCHN